jgi:predicted ester cyclase
MPNLRTSQEENKRIARTFIEEVLNRREGHRLAEFVAPECEVRGAPMKGLAYFEEHYRTFMHAYPDLQVSVEGQVAEGDIVVTWFRATGTHEGDSQGIKATHRPLHLNGVNIQRIRDGRIVEHWGGANTLEAFLELGVIQWVQSSPGKP